MLFIIEYAAQRNSELAQPNWKILVWNNEWIYSKRSEAERIIEGCQTDHDDEIQCYYRVRAVSRHEALQLASTSGLADSDVVPRG